MSLFQTAPAGLGSDYDHSDLHVIPLWANLQLLGQDKISSMLHFNASLAQQLAHKISSIPQLFLLVPVIRYFDLPNTMYSIGPPLVLFYDIRFGPTDLQAFSKQAFGGENIFLILRGSTRQKPQFLIKTLQIAKNV